MILELFDIIFSLIRFVARFRSKEREVLDRGIKIPLDDLHFFGAIYVQFNEDKMGIFQERKDKFRMRTFHLEPR
jgi:hypothetical protein